MAQSLGVLRIVLTENRKDNNNASNFVHLHNARMLCFYCGKHCFEIYIKLTRQVINMSLVGQRSCSRNTVATYSKQYTNTQELM